MPTLLRCGGGTPLGSSGAPAPLGIALAAIGSQTKPPAPRLGGGGTPSGSIAPWGCDGGGGAGTRGTNPRPGLTSDPPGAMGSCGCAALSAIKCAEVNHHFCDRLDCYRLIKVSKVPLSNEVGKD